MGLLFKSDTAFVVVPWHTADNNKNNGEKMSESFIQEETETSTTTKTEAKVVFWMPLLFQIGVTCQETLHQNQSSTPCGPCFYSLLIGRRQDLHRAHMQLLNPRHSDQKTSH